MFTITTNTHLYLLLEKNSIVSLLFVGTMPTSSQSTITSQQNITFNGLSLGSTNVTYDHTFLTFDSFLFIYFLMTDDAQNSQ